VYIPWDLGRIFWEVLNVDHGKVLANSIRWANGGPGPLTVTGPGILDVTLWRLPDALTVHLVNLTNPMMMRGPFRELLPVGPQTVALRLPEGARPRRVRLLTPGAGGADDLAYLVSEGYLRLEVPRVLDHVVVAVDLCD
jgi:hypothetical protein